MEYDILHTLDFDPHRKCMSIVVCEKGGPSDIILYTKGADSVIYSHLAAYEAPEVGSLPESGFEDLSASRSLGGSGQSSAGEGDTLGRGLNEEGGEDNEDYGALVKDVTQYHLNNYAKLGLRTLCMAKRVRSFKFHYSICTNTLTLFLL